MGHKKNGQPQNAHGRGTAWQLPNGTWRARVQIGKKRICGAGKSERDARAEMNRRVRAYQREALKPAPVALVVPPIPVDLPNGREYVRASDPVFRRWIYRRDGGLCGVCGQPVVFEQMHLDHVTPRSEGGTDHVSNYRISHGACNLRENARRLRLIRV